MIETKTISSISELKVGEKSKKPYFVVDFTDNTKAVCFVPALHNEIEVGKTYPLDINPPQKEGYSPQLVKLIKAEDLPAPTKPKPMPSAPEISGPEIGLWWKQLGDDLRSGHIDRNSSVGKALRLTYFAQMFKVLNIDLKELQASETKTTPPSKPATAGTQLKTKGTGAVSPNEQSEGEV